MAEARDDALCLGEADSMQMALPLDRLACKRRYRKTIRDTKGVSRKTIRDTKGVLCPKWRVC